MDLNIFLSILSNEIEERGLKLVVIRNYDTLPQRNSGNDIDVIVNENDVSLWLSILGDICDTNGLTLDVTKKYYYCTKTIIHGVDDKFGRLELDLNNRFEWRGLKFYSSDSLISNSIRFNREIYTSSNELSAFITFCHSFLYGGFIQRKYSKEYKLLTTEKGKVQFKELSSPFMSFKDIDKILTSLEDEKYDLSKFEINIIRIKILLKSIIYKPFKTTKGFLYSLYYDFFC
tara:strand:- start:2509 stop:3201 length:693 start_codon:yes stop_codon:yes gene_type:complete